MALSIDQLRSAFTKKTEGGGNSGFWDNFFPFYKMDFDQQTVVRFLPDKNEDNPLGFIVENKYHDLIINGQKKSIACLKMYDEACPCCEESARFYNEGDQVTGKKYYRRIDYIAQAVITETPLEIKPRTDNPENPVRLLSMGPQIFRKIEAAFKSGDLDSNPTDMIGGYNFRLHKTKKGEYADYSTSDFVRKPSDIPTDVLDKIDLYDLSKYRYAKVERETMEIMMNAEKTGASYGNEAKDSSAGQPDSASSQPDSAAPSEQPSAAQDTKPGKSSAEDILAKIRARAQANKTA